MPKAIVNIEARTVVWVFEDEVAADAEKGIEGKLSRETFEASKVPGYHEGIDATALQLVLHGAKQKVSDSYAGAKESGVDPLTYTKEAVRDTIKQLYDGKWSIGRTGSGAPRTTFLVTAFAEVTGKTLEEAQEFIGSLTDEEKTAVAKKPKIAAVVARLKAEAAIKKADELAKKAAEAEAKEVEAKEMSGVATA